MIDWVIKGFCFVVGTILAVVAVRFAYVHYVMYKLYKKISLMK